MANPPTINNPMELFSVHVGGSNFSSLKLSDQTILLNHDPHIRSDNQYRNLSSDTLSKLSPTVLEYTILQIIDHQREQAVESYRTSVYLSL